MRLVLNLFTVVAFVTFAPFDAVAQSKSALEPTPRAVSMEEMKSVEKLDGQLVQLTAVVRHTDTAQVFTFGEKTGQEFHTVIPNRRLTAHTLATPSP